MTETKCRVEMQMSNYIDSKRKETKPVREEELGPAFSSAAYDVILNQSKQSVFRNFKFK